MSESEVSAPLGFLGDIYETSCEVIALQLEKPHDPGKNQTWPNGTIAEDGLVFVTPFWKYR